MTAVAKLTLGRAADDYMREHLVRKGKGWRRIAICFKFFFQHISSKLDCEELTSEQLEEYADWRMKTYKVNPLTARADLIFVQAMLKHAKKRNRIKLIPHFAMPEGPFAKRRPLTEDEYVKVVDCIHGKQEFARLERFYILTYWTGVRSQAAEDLKWTRVDLDRRIINFNPEGRKVTPTKRRVDCFPIPDELYAILVDWKREAKDEYVIGAGPRGRCTTTYHHAAYAVRVLAGITDPTLVPRHCMRKMYATVLFDKGANPEHVGALTGDNPDMLRKHYIKFEAERLRVTANMRAS